MTRDCRPGAIPGGAEQSLYLPYTNYVPTTQAYPQQEESPTGTAVSCTTIPDPSPNHCRVTHH